MKDPFQWGLLAVLGALIVGVWNIDHNTEDIKWVLKSIKRSYEAPKRRPTDMTCEGMPEGCEVIEGRMGETCVVWSEPAYESVVYCKTEDRE